MYDDDSSCVAAELIATSTRTLARTIIFPLWHEYSCFIEAVRSRGWDQKRSRFSKVQKQHALLGHGENTAETTPGRVEGGKHYQARGSSGPRCGPHREETWKRVGTWCKNMFSALTANRLYYPAYVYTISALDHVQSKSQSRNMSEIRDTHALCTAAIVITVYMVRVCTSLLVFTAGLPSCLPVNPRPHPCRGYPRP